jgi:hypothetical protein
MSIRKNCLKHSNMTGSSIKRDMRTEIQRLSDARIAFSVITGTVCVSMYNRYATRVGIVLTGKGGEVGWV